MSLFEQVIKRPALTVAVAISIAAVGAAGLFGLGRTTPSTKPAIVASLIYPGADASEVERTAVNPLEARIASLRGVSKVESSARAGVATITVWFETEDDIERTSGPLADAVGAIAKQFGSSVGVPAIVRLSTDSVSPSTASVRELAPTALVAAALTLAIILLLLRSRSAAVIVVSAVVLASVAALGILRPAKLPWDASVIVGLMLAAIVSVDAALRAR
ncbi:MAG TPA: efflux RND transporter permease subunit, partial [Vicinamibacterales bacterium]